MRQTAFSWTVAQMMRFGPLPARSNAPECSPRVRVHRIEGQEKPAPKKRAYRPKSKDYVRPMVDCVCDKCGITFQREKCRVDRNRREGKGGLFCKRSCASKFNNPARKGQPYKGVK